MGEDGYPKYRHRPPSEGGFTAKIKLSNVEFEIDNQWVVLYNLLFTSLKEDSDGSELEFIRRTFAITDAILKKRRFGSQIIGSRLQAN